MKQRVLGSLPVLTHHLVSNDTRFLSVTPKIFEEQCRVLADNGWRGNTPVGLWDTNYNRKQAYYGFIEGMK